MYHVSNLGAFAGHVSRYADIDGFVPQEEDEHEDMRWDSAGPGWDDDQWDEHVADAVAATEEAEIAIGESR